MNIQPFFCSFPIIDLGDVVLREISKEDADAYLNYINNNKMLKFLTEENIPQNLDAAIAEINYWKSLFPLKKSIYWAITIKGIDKMIGTAGFNIISFTNSRADISYDLDPNFWGKGIMFRSIKAILDFSEYTLGITRVQATVITTNERSINLLKRSGFQKEGRLRKYELILGKLRDSYIYGRVSCKPK